MSEVWESLKGIVEYGEYYEVSNLGNVRSIDRFIEANKRKRFCRGKVLKQKKNKYGYLCVTLGKEGKRKHYLSHRLVALAFIPMLEGKEVVNHINGIKDDNRLENLEWATFQENVRHAFDTGLVKVLKGEKNPNCGRKHSDESKKYLSEINKGEKNPFYGKTHSTKAKMKMSKRARGRYCGKKSPLYGKTPSTETRRKMSEAKKGICGEKHNRAKLTEKKVVEIKRLLAKGKQVAEVARKYGVSYSTIGSIKHGRTWTHIV